MNPNGAQAALFSILQVCPQLRLSSVQVAGCRVQVTGVIPLMNSGRPPQCFLWFTRDERYSMAKSFRDLVVWQRAMQLASLLYRLTQKLPREESHGLTAQLRRAGVSIASNIAEGSGRGTRSDYRSFLRMARGSALEVQTQLLLARDLGFGNSAQIAQAEEFADEISRMLWAIAQKL
jgi:four helix bundle protein